jgi:hypothetical protein
MNKSKEEGEGTSIPGMVIMVSADLLPPFLVALLAQNSAVNAYRLVQLMVASTYMTYYYILTHVYTQRFIYIKYIHYYYLRGF